ncbi:hypothetical protein PoB_007602700 [Plakobranchus ocellatus]|uniref:Uncharacterized protein n=1 Tax=Plakobranchus ocellatus TaxID=259542 RepID=A0AAV4DZR3_9GAST|nr:hypothetical protein PoB_007602700 [Plakobranchus ocellatus]
MVESLSCVPPTSPTERTKDVDIERMSRHDVSPTNPVATGCPGSGVNRSSKKARWTRSIAIFLLTFRKLSPACSVLKTGTGQSAAFDFKGLRPRNPNSNLPLKLKCSFDLSKSSLTNVTRLKIMRTKIREDKTPFRTIAVVGPKGVGYALSPNLISASGKIGPTSQLDVTYKIKVAGYCFEYACVAEGTNQVGARRFAHTKIRISSVMRTGCLPRKPTSNDNWLHG